MRKTITIGILLMLAIFSLSFSASAVDVTSIEMNEIDIQDASGFGPGSEIPLYSPFESGYVWVSGIEPVKAIWTIYNPVFQRVISIEHIPSIKSHQTDGTWRFGDRSAFTLPAFAMKGTWLAKCEFLMADGTTLTLGSAENMDVIYMGYPVDRSDDFASIFIAPWYWLGIGWPPLFFVPGFILWVPLLYVAFCAIFSRSIGGFVFMTKQALASGSKARGQFKRSKKKAKKGKK